MKRKVIWTFEAIETFTNIIEYIENNWSKKESEDFIGKTERVIEFISQNPFLFRRTNLKSVREALVSIQTLLIYKVHKDRIELITFWDTRKNPTKKKSGK